MFLSIFRSFRACCMQVATCHILAYILGRTVSGTESVRCLCASIVTEHVAHLIMPVAMHTR